jgi:broad specificity phosphatase PhoE
MTHIILVRHGQTAWNREERFRGHANISLDETGLHKLKLLQNELRWSGNPM